MHPVTDPASGLPIGPLDDGPPAKRPDRRTLAGRFVTLVPLDPEQHGDDLFAASRGPEHDALWLYLNAGPFAERAAFGTYLESVAGRDEPVTLAVVDTASGRAVGHLGLMRIKPAHKVIEVGNILYTAALARRRGGTEAIYLAARHVFEDLGFVRFEWKCNALNAPSRRAALRFGFTFEGVFPRHMIQKGRLRDTAWFSMLASEWPARRAAFEAWLAAENFDPTGRQKARLGALMAEAIATHQGENERTPI
ncbi:GNAT family N-acetyltransferase [Rhodoplanes roseus]|uniref:GNAT family N-acetyltransferase n=1 Tax=Rhodoplanes roseus TaxID=29409 RepID=A0A327L3T9_9BRAD|nr:GNAT family protein [Rhodoplanes roseus]RAI44493.1 GNAT family N-acetyltransferase [Rhodoplanes roseus]